MDIIQDLVDTYNDSRYRSINMAPVNVHRKHEGRFWMRVFWNGDTHLKSLILQRAMLLVRKYKTIFDKGYMPNWNKEHFTVSAAVPPKTITKRRVYMFVD